MKISHLTCMFIILLITLLNNNILAYKISSQNQQDGFSFTPQKDSGTKVVVSTKNDARDSSVTYNNNAMQANKIVNIWKDADGNLNVEANVVNNKNEIRISVFNMLGKEICKIYKGIPTHKNDKGHYIFVSTQPINLPKNIYILVMQSNAFKIADKFIITN